MATNLSQYLPTVYNDVGEMQELQRTLSLEVDNVVSSMSKTNNNLYIQTCDVETITYFENIIGIVVKESDAIDFRRARILNRLSLIPSFTKNYLKQKLDSLVGVGLWELDIDYGNYIITLKATVKNQQWFDELQATIFQLLPANIVFINLFSLTSKTFCNERVAIQQHKYSYLVNMPWNLGKDSIISYGNLVVVKMETTPSLQIGWFTDLANAAVKMIDHVLINDKWVISNFSKLVASVSNITINYVIPPSITDSAVINYKLIGKDGIIYADCDVFQPIEPDSQFTHTINIFEGVD